MLSLLIFVIVISCGHVWWAWRRPSPLSLRAIMEILQRTRVLFTTAVAAALLIEVLSLRVTATGLGWAILTLGAVTTGFTVWLHTSFTRTLQRDLQGMELDLQHVDDNGLLVAGGRDPLPNSTPAQARFAIWIGGLLMVASFITLVWILASMPTPLVVNLAVVAYWLTLGTIAMDLCLDVWPSWTTSERIRLCHRYYVHIFELASNRGVLAGLLGSLILGPWSWLSADVGIGVLTFPLCIVLCIVFASIVNRFLVPAGLIKRPLPLPMARNQYAAHPPIWAWFLTTIHVIMVIALVGGLWALQARLVAGM